MSVTSPEALVEQRVAQLQIISNRRNELLRQMYHMIQRRNNVGPVLSIDEKDDGDIHAFLERLKNPITGSIATLDEDEILLQLQPTSSSGTPSPTQEKITTRRMTRSQSHVTNHTTSPSPSPSKQSTTSVPLGVINFQSVPLQGSKDSSLTKSQGHKEAKADENRDELDLIDSPLSDDEEKKAHNEATEAPTPSLVEEKQRASHTVSPKPDPAISNDEADMEVEGKSRLPIVDAAEEDDAMKIDEEVVPESSKSSGEEQESATTPAETTAGTAANDAKPINTATGASNDSDILMKEPLTDADDDMDAASEAEVSKAVDRQSSQGLTRPTTTIIPPSNEPIKSSIPPTSLGPSSPIPVAEAARPPIIILAPGNVVADSTTYTFDQSTFTGLEQPKTPGSPAVHRHQFNPNYTLPPLKSLPPEFNRKVKQKQKRREKEKGEGKKEEWYPMGINRWAATLNANPVWKRVARAPKCLSTREWAVAMAELKLIRTFDRIETLKDNGRWSFRQPKKQRGVGGLVKTHWDYLMDEMKWMRIDFREERRWKLALAYHLSTAVLEWHAASSQEERIKRGICVLWRPSFSKREKPQHEVPMDEPMPLEDAPERQPSQPLKQNGSLLGVDYGSDDGEDAEQEKEQQDVVDALEPQNVLEEALESPLQEESQPDQQETIKLKIEDMDDASMLQLNETENMQTEIQQSTDTVDRPMTDAARKDDKTPPSGLKSTSSDPFLGQKSNSNSSSDSETPVIPGKASLKQLYGPLRERILESDIEKLFLDLDDFHITQQNDGKNDAKEATILDLPPADLPSLFPDLQPFGLLDVPPLSASVVAEGKKKSDKRSDRDDPTKRIEDTTYTKLFPIGQFMHSKPTLIGPLQPSKNWKDGKWLPMDVSPVYVEYEGPTRPPEDAMNEIFDNRLSNSTIIAQHQLVLAATRERDKDRKRTSDHQWGANDDALLKSLIDRYPYNWQLVSECFNAMRVTTTTDKRTARDCFERWREKWAPDVRRHQELQQANAAAAAGTPQSTDENANTSGSNAGAATGLQMTTRGVKRLASSMTASPVVSGSSGSEPKKRRRHILVQETIRKSVKKKAEFQQKMLANQRKPSAMHETHLQYNSMHVYSPVELSRIKAEKDQKHLEGIQVARRRQEEATKNLQARLNPAQQSLLQQQAALLQQQQAAQQQAQQQLQVQPSTSQSGQTTPGQVQQGVAQAVTQQVTQQAQIANIAQRPPNAILANQALNNIRGPVNISRMNSPNIAAGAPRLTPQQILQMQQAQQQGRPGSQPAQSGQLSAQQLAQAQAQAQILMPSLNGNGAHLAATFNRDSTSSPAHLSPPRKSSTPVSNTMSSPRPATEQAQTQHGQVQMGMMAGVQQATAGIMGRPTGSMNYYNIPGLTQEQINSVLRLQIMQQQQQATQQQDSST